jgi:hypothetical protein
MCVPCLIVLAIRISKLLASAGDTALPLRADRCDARMIARLRIEASA